MVLGSPIHVSGILKHLEGRTMQTNGTIVSGSEIPTLSEVWGKVKDWAGRVLTSEKKPEATLTAGTLVLLGYVVFVVHQGLLNRTIVGF